MKFVKKHFRNIDRIFNREKNCEYQYYEEGKSGFQVLHYVRLSEGDRRVKDIRIMNKRGHGMDTNERYGVH